MDNSVFTKIFYNQKNLWKDCRKIYFYFKEEENFEPEIILGIARGGVIPATYLAYQFDVPLYTVYFSTYSQYKKNKKLNSKIEMLEKIQNYIKINDLIKKRILIVDDIVDTGETMKTIKSFFKKNKVKTASLYINLNIKQKYRPDFHLYTKKINEWVIFPWEIKNIDYKEIS